MGVSPRQLFVLVAVANLAALYITAEVGSLGNLPALAGLKLPTFSSSDSNTSKTATLNTSGAKTADPAKASNADTSPFTLGEGLLLCQPSWSIRYVGESTSTWQNYCKTIWSWSADETPAMHPPIHLSCPHHLTAMRFLTC